MVFGIIWIIVLISIFSKIAQKNRQNMTRTNQQRQGQTTAAASGSASRPNFRNVPGATYGTTRNVQQTGSGTAASRNSGYGQGAFAPTHTSGKITASRRKDTARGFGSSQPNNITANPVLFEDRRNDWLAKQLREEAAIKRRGSIYDLGAAHDVTCDADLIKKSHVKRHNSNGLNRQTFR